MKMGVHKNGLAESVALADRAIVLRRRGLHWDLGEVFDPENAAIDIANNNEEIVAVLKNELRRGDHVLIMSNGSFGGLHQQLLNMLDLKQTAKK